MTTELELNRIGQAEFLDLVHRRRATRSFAEQPLTEAEIEALIEAARWAPSPSNRQPWKFLSIADPAIRSRMREEVAAACQYLVQKKVGSDARAVEEYLRNFTLFGDAPTVIAIMVRKTVNRMAEGSSETSAIETEGVLMAAGMAMQNILLAAVANGMVACPMSGPMIARPKLEEILDITSPWSLVALIPVGWPGPDQPIAPERKRTDLLWSHLS